MHGVRIQLNSKHASLEVRECMTRFIKNVSFMYIKSWAAYEGSPEQIV